MNPASVTVAVAVHVHSYRDLWVKYIDNMLTPSRASRRERWQLVPK
jgi:hypothetical protein